MATIAEIITLFRADTKDFEAGSKRVQQGIDQTSRSLGDLGGGFLKAGALISGAITAPLVAISEMGRSFETELRRVAANTAMTDAELAKMRDTVMDLGRNSAAPLADIAHGFEHAANFGFNAAEAAKILDVAMQGAVATGAHTTDVTNTLAGVLHQFGLSADQASVTLNTLKEAAGKGNLTLEQMVAVSGRVFSTAANLGLSLNEAAGAMSALTRAGFPAAQASTQLVGALTHLVNPSKEVRGELAALSKASGIDLVHDFSQAGLQAKGFSGVLADVKKAVGDNTAEILKLFGGIRGGMGAMALAGNAAEDYRKILDQLGETMAGKLTPIQDAYAREVNTLGFQFGELKNRLTLLGDALNSAFSGDQVNFVKSLNDAVSGLTAGFNALDPSMKAAIATFLGAFAISGPILLGVGAIAALIGGPLTIAIVGVSAALSILAADWLSDNDKAKGSTESLKQSLLELVPILGMVADLMGIVANAAFVAWSASVAQIRSVIQFLTGDWVGAMKTIDDSNRMMSKGLGNIWDELNGKWEGTLNKLVNAAFSASSGFAAAGRANAAAYQSGLNSALGGSLSLKTPLDKLAASNAPKAFDQVAMEGGARITGVAVGKALTDGIAGGVKSGHGKIKAAVDETFAAVTDWMRSSNLGDLSKSVWDKLAQTVKNSLKSQADEFHKSKDELQTYKANIIALMDGLGFEVIKANNAIGVSFKQSADTIAVTSAQVSTSLRSFADGFGPAFDQLQVDSAKATAALVADSQKRVENYNAEQKAADDSFRSLAAHVESMGHDIPEGLRKITDGFVMMSGKTGEAMLLMLQKVRSWGHDVVQVIETLPGRFGDVARGILKTADQWIVFFDRVLQFAHRFSSSIPESIEAAISKIAGLFKGMGKSAQDAGQYVGNGLVLAANETGKATNSISNSTSGMSEKVKAGFGIAAASAAGFATSLAITANSSSKAMGFLEATISSTLAGIAAGFAFGPVAGAITAGVSLLGGIIGLFHKKSAQQAEQERLNNDKLKADIAASAQATMNAALEGFQKALAFLDSLDQFTAPRKAKFQEFWKAMSRLMDGFVVLAKKWQGENLEKDKAIAEAIGAVAQGIAAAPAAFDAINSSFTIPDTQFEVFFSNLDRFMTRFFARADVWIEGTAKRAMKVANRLASVVDLISPFAQGMKDLVDLKPIGDDALNALDDGLQKLITRIGAIADKFDKGWLKTLQFFSEKAQSALSLWKDAVEAIKATVDIPPLNEGAIDAVVANITAFIAKLIAASDSISAEALGKAASIANSILPIANAIKAWSEAAKLIHDYTAVAADTYDAILADFNRAISLINLMLGSAIDFLPKAIQFEDVMAQIANHLKAALDAFGPGLGAAASAFGLIVNTIQGGVPIGGGDVGGGSFAPSFAGGGASSAASSSSIHVHVHAGTFVHESQLPDLIAEGLVNLKRTSRLQRILAT